MKAKKLLPILLSAAACTFGLSGCSDYDNDYNEKDIAFNQSFVNVFGNPDPNQTWSTASRSTLDVSVDMPSTYDDCTVKIYTANPRGNVKNSYLLGEWKVNNDSSSKFTFDMPCDLKTAWVAIVNKDGGRIVKEARINNNSCKAEFKLNGNSTRATSTGTFSEGNTWTGFPISRYYNAAYETDPENETPGFIQIYPENKLDYSRGLCTDFEFVATGEDITFTHFYACTDGNDKIYYFSYDPATETLEQAYADHDKHIALCDGAAAHTQCYVGSTNLSSYGTNGWKTISDGSIDEGIKNGQIINAPATWNDGYNDHNNENVGSAFRGKTFTISGCTPGEHLVFYLYQDDPDYTAGSDNIAATRSAINKPFYQLSSGKNLKPQLAGVLTVGGVTYLGFEDALSWGGHNTNPNEYYDINDVVFTVTGGYTIEDHEDKIEQAMSYIIAYEDLGGSYDFDFNDIVLKVTHVSGRPTATISVLAAGGTLPVKISYDNKVICDDVHAAFGEDTETVINAYAGLHHAYPVQSFTVNGIEDDFALSKINISVDQDSNGEYESTMHAPQYYKTSIEDEAHQVGTAESTLIPYAILIANPNWDWPSENISIANQDGFIDWVADASKVQWYQEGNTWGVSNDVPSNENVISGSTVYQKIAASQFSECTYGATVTFTISNFTADGDLSFYTAYNGIEGATSSTALESQASITVTSSSETTVTLELSAHCEAFDDGLIVVYDNSKFKVSAISVTPAEAPSYGNEIEFTYDGSYTYGYKILLNEINNTLSNLSDDDNVTITLIKASETSSSCGNIIGGMNGYYAYQCTTLTPSEKTDNDAIIQAIFKYSSIKNYDFVTIPLQSYTGGTVGQHITNIYIK